jgi:hypothetical protein
MRGNFAYKFAFQKFFARIRNRFLSPLVKLEGSNWVPSVLRAVMVYGTVQPCTWKHLSDLTRADRPCVDVGPLMDSSFPIHIQPPQVALD